MRSPPTLSILADFALVQVNVEGWIAHIDIRAKADGLREMQWTCPVTSRINHRASIQARFR